MPFPSQMVPKMERGMCTASGMSRFLKGSENRRHEGEGAGGGKCLRLPTFRAPAPSGECDLSFSTVLPSQQHQPQAAMITSEVSALVIWGPGSQSPEYLPAGTPSPLPMIFPVFTGDAVLQGIARGTYKQLQMSTRVLFPNRL